jgi:hypothetical protein
MTVKADLSILRPAEVVDTYLVICHADTGYGVGQIPRVILDKVDSLLFKVLDVLKDRRPAVELGSPFVIELGNHSHRRTSSIPSPISWSFPPKP